MIQPLFHPDGTPPPFAARWRTGAAEAGAPVAAGDSVVLGTQEHFLASVGSEGRVRWTVDVPDRLAAPAVVGQDGRTLALGESGVARCVDASGAVLWEAPSGRLDAPAAPTPDGGWLLPGGGALRRLSAEGAEAWTWTPPAHPLRPTTVGPVIAGPDGTTYVATCLHLSEPRWEIVALDAQGAEAWRRPVPEVRDLELLPEGSVVAGGAKGVAAFRPDGTPAWKNGLHCEGLHRGPAGTLFVEGWNEVDLLGPDGGLRWRYSGHGGRSLTTGTAGYDLAVAPDGRALVANAAWDWKRFGGAVLLDPEGQPTAEAREGNVSGAAFTSDGTLVLASAQEVRAVDPGAVPEGASIDVEEEWIEVGGVRLPRR